MDVVEKVQDRYVESICWLTACNLHLSLHQLQVLLFNMITHFYFTCCYLYFPPLYSRDRNREHAKNTRLRKKAYVIKLKELAEQLERQKINDEIEKKVSAMKVCQTDATRRNVVRLFLSYRESNIQDKSTWEAIVEDNFVFTLPITPYRSFLKRDVISGSRVLVGINALIADTASLSLMVESVGQGSCQWKESMKR